MAADLQLAHDIVDEAGRLGMDYFGRTFSSSLKSDGSIVTEADQALERLIRAQLGQHRATDALLGEEYGRLGDAPRTWIIDPIDGTSFFAAGDPNWRIHLALQEDEEITLAVVGAPALGLRWWATRGGGAYEAAWTTDQGSTGLGTPKRLTTTVTTELGQASIDAYPIESGGRLPAAVHRPEPSPLGLVDLVRGEIDGFVVECCEIWDHAPWILLVEEAGGRFTDRRGGRAGDQRGGLYSNTPLHERLLDSLGYGRPGR